MAKTVKNLKRELLIALSARHPLINIISEDEKTVSDTLKSPEITEEHLLLFFDLADGAVAVNAKEFPLIDEDSINEELRGLGTNLIDTLNFFKNISQQFPTILVIKDIDKILNDNNQNTYLVLRHIKNILDFIKEGKGVGTIIFLSETLKNLPLLERDLLILYLNFPDREEIGEILDIFLEENNLSISETLRVELISALQGLTRTEIENLLFLILERDNEINENVLDFIFEYKKQIVSKRGILEFIDIRKLPDNVGGLKNLKKWLEKKRVIFHNLDRAIKKGVAIPKGVLLFGMPGCGKSMTAKYTAKLLKLPLLRLDMGKIMGPYLGQSEENMRKAIAIAEAIAPSILWIDELEKALSGVKGGGNTNDTLVRIFGTLLTWMQEKDKPVFVIATANDISALPPEFLRKGRFDEIFFVDFPSKEDMKEIFAIQLKRAKQNPSKIDLNKVIEYMEEGYSGADIEAIVNETVERVFLNGKDQVTTDDLIETIRSQTIKPTAKLLKDSIQELRKKIEKIDAKRAN